jgi:D-alanyl-D-alanine carboxypeptidase/D-alanyl-D-alanine-endopeptidase (penicillin-binding protein 4)
VAKHLGAVRFGKPGSTAKGISAMKEYLSSAGLKAEDYLLENASGLSANTRISSLQLAKLLAAVYRDFSIRPEFMSSLAIAGVDGTMKRWNFAGELRGMARAKTGTLNNVSTLAGYVPTKSGRIAAFAILINGLKHGADAAHRAQMKIINAISESR